MKIVHGLLTAENKTFKIGILPISKDPMMGKITHHTNVSFFVEIRTFQFAAASLLALFVGHKLRTKLIIKIGMIYRNNSTGSLPYQFIK